jgi:hypothetical protein
MFNSTKVIINPLSGLNKPRPQSQSFVYLSQGSTFLPTRRPDPNVVSPPPLTSIPAIVTPRPLTPPSPTILSDRGGTVVLDTSPCQPISPPTISPFYSPPSANVALALPQDTAPPHAYSRREKPQPRRSFRIRRPSIRLQDISSIHEVTHSSYHVDSYFIGSIEDNLTFTQASQQSQWISAMQEEMQAIHSNNTWTLIDLPRGKRAISSRWLYKLKLGLNGQGECYKARLIARTNEQKPGIDFEDTFAPVAK